MGHHSLPSPPSLAGSEADKSPNDNDGGAPLPSPPSSSTPPPGKRKEREDSIEPESTGKKPRTDPSEAEGDCEPPGDTTSDGKTGVDGGEAIVESKDTATNPVDVPSSLEGTNLFPLRETSPVPESPTTLRPNSSIFEGGPNERKCCKTGKCDDEFHQFVLRPGMRLPKSVCQHGLGPQTNCRQTKLTLPSTTSTPARKRSML